MLRSTRAVVLPVAIAVPLLGIVGDLIDPFIARTVVIAPWQNPSTVIWLGWGLFVPLVLALDEKRRGVFLHLAVLALIIAMHTGFSLYVNFGLVVRLAERGELAGFIWIDRVPRYLGIDLLVYMLTIAAAHALRSHFVLRERERAAAELDADVRRAELDLVRTHIDREHVLGELAAIRDDVGRDSLRAEQRIEALSDYFERQLAAMQLSESTAREPIPEPKRERRILGLTPSTWLVLLLAPFVARLASSGVAIAASIADGTFDWGRFGRTVLLTVYTAACIPAIVAATLPHGKTVALRVAHFALLALLCFVLSFVPDMLIARDLVHIISGPRAVVLNRFFFIAIATAVLAAQYARRTRERETESARMQARLADAQLRALHMQLHPHFLFNTLNAIAGLLDDEPAAARLMTERLERFLRMSLTLGDAQEVVLREELRFVMTYLEIQRARFGERLHVALEADDRVLDALVPPLVLQPLVENAIRHGIGPRKSGGTVAVKAAAHENGLALTIEDDGEGVAVDSLEPGIGLTNTRARLRQLYGAQHRVTMRSASGEGFAVELLLPLRFAHV